VHIAAAEWIVALACTRGSGICMADKLLLLVMWKRAPYDLRGHATGKQVYPSRRLLAEETGQTLDAVRDQLRRLLAAGWIRVDGDGWALAWVTPFEVAQATLTRFEATQVTEPSVDSGDSSRRPPATLTPGEATLTAGPGDSNRRPSEQERSNPPDEHTTAREPDPGVDSSGSQPREPEPTPSAKPRRQPVAEPVDADPAFAELLALHGALRKRAQACHGLRVTPLPGPGCGDGRSLRLRLRKALADHGLAVCRRALEHQAGEWAKDPGACSRWSTDSMWSPKSLAVSIPRSAGQAQARASPNKPRGPTLSCEPVPGEMPRLVYDKNGPCL
jgi:hypothetical protein